MHALTGGESPLDEERAAEPVAAAPSATENAARPRCLFCRYRVPAAAMEISDD